MLTVLAFLSAVSFAAARDSVIYPSLANRGVSDCPAVAAAQSASICRVQRAYDADAVRARLDAGDHVWRDGDALTFAWRGAADVVELSGGVGFPMGHIAGTDLWVLTVRADSLDRAVISYTFFASSTAGPSAAPAPIAYWRGPRAPVDPPRSAALHGRLINDTIASSALGMRRALSVYVPPPRGAEGVARVLYMADGQELAAFAPVLDTLIAARKLPRILIVGLHSDPSPMTPIPGRPGAYEPDGRSREYLPGIDTARFAAHQRFLLQEVLPYAERAYGAPRGAGRRTLFGFSNGAAFAGAMALTHPDRFGTAIALSPGGGARSFAALSLPSSPGQTRTTGQEVYVSGGLYEPGFRTNAHALAALFERAGASVVLREPAGGHDEGIWQREFADALKWGMRVRAPSAR